MYDIASMSANDKTRNHLIANNNIYNSRKKLSSYYLWLSRRSRTSAENQRISTLEKVSHTRFMFGSFLA